MPVVINAKEACMTLFGSWVRIGAFVSALFLSSAAFGTEPEPLAEAPAAGWEYAAFMRHALVHSPHLSKTALQLRIRRMDEDDSRSEMLPEVSLHATHYVSEGSSIGIAADTYRPFEAYYSLKVRQILTEIAKLRHVTVLSEAHYTVAQHFFRHEHLNKMIDVQRELIVQAQKKHAYAENRRQAGAASQLDARIAAQELSVRRAELKSLEINNAALLDTLTRFIDGDPARPVALDTADIRRLLPPVGFVPPETDRILGASPVFRIARLGEQLQQYHIRLAHAAYIPTFSMELRQPDIIDEPHNDDFVFAVCARFPLWDGGKRHRDIARQKIVMEQVETETWLQKNALIDTWHSAAQDLEKAGTELSLSAAAEELSALKLAQTRLLYEQDKAPLPALFDDTLTYHVARKNHLKNQLAHDLAQLLVHHLSGNLFGEHIHLLNLQDIANDNN
ncbi:MAG: TolC family protein [Pseudomonadota bacterium]